MRKKSIKYLSKMAVKTLVLMLPLLLIVLPLSVEGGIPLGYEVFNGFKSLSINLWYSELLSLLFGDMSSCSDLINMISYYPLYVIWVEIFDLVVHVFMLIPELGHKFLGGKDND